MSFEPVTIIVRFGADLAQLAGTRELDVILDLGECNIEGLVRKLQDVVSKQLAGELLDVRTGKPLCLVTVNGRLVSPTALSMKILKNGDRVTFIPAASGGLG